MVRRAVHVIRLALFLGGAACCNSFLLGIDLGSQYFKAALVAPGKAFEVVHNQHSKRKTPTAVSFHEKIRSFGDDAVTSASRSPAKTPMFFSLLLGKNYTEATAESLHWLPARFYPYKLGLNESGSLHFSLGEESLTVEEAAAHILSFAKSLARLVVEGVAVSETIMTIPSHATRQQRMALLAAADIAGLPRPQLLHETSAAALQRALDVDLGGGAQPSFNGSEAVEAQTSKVLFYNMGARHVEACVVEYRGATHQGKNTTAMSVLGCGGSDKLGGHQVDLIIAEKMLAAFLAKHPKLSDITSSTRALKKLEKEAMALKHVLSANKEAQYRVEALYEDTDFAQIVTRETLETWCLELFSSFSDPVEAALATANTTFAELEAVEMIGGGWRIPRVQSLLSEYLQAKRPSGSPPLNLSQHVNGDEAMATGAAFYGANSSVSVRAKRIFFTDAMPHRYSIEIRPLNESQPHEEGWVRAVELFPLHAKLRAKMTVKTTVAFDLLVTLIEDGNVVCHWELANIHAAATGQFEALGTPLISLKFELDSSGVVQLASASAIFDQPLSVNTTSNVTEEQESEAMPDPELANNSNGNATKTSEKPKIKKRKIGLVPVETYKGVLPRPLLQEEIAEAAARLEAMDAADAEVRALEAAKNALESFILESRDKLSTDEACITVSTEEVREQVGSELTAMEEWLYEPEALAANASTLQDKLQTLKASIEPILRRAWEFEQRPLLPDVVDKVLEYANKTLEYVAKNMTWVTAADQEGVGNLTVQFQEWYENVTEAQKTAALTEDPAFSVVDVRRRLERIRSEVHRLTKIQKIDPIPYSRDYDRYGGYGRDPRMRAWYEAMMRNMSKNDSNASDWFRRFSNFSDTNWNESDYMRSFYEFSKNGTDDGNASSHGTSSSGSDEKAESETADKSEL